MRIRRSPGSQSSIYADMSELAARTQSINLGQGFTEWGPTAFVEQAAAQQVTAGDQQYPPPRGVPVLRERIAQHIKQYRGIELNPEREVVVTSGASEAIVSALLAFTAEGDEVIIFEPFFDFYLGCIDVAGATVVPVPLTAPQFTLDLQALSQAITPRTRAIILNTPGNPAGNVFSAQELAAVAHLAQQHDLLIIADEVYDHYVYEGSHVSIATLPGMFERTLTVGAASKTFSVTGWRIGWVTGPAEILDPVLRVRQHLSFTAPGPLQRAIAEGLTLPQDFFASLGAELVPRRDLLCEALQEIGAKVIPPAGGFFVFADLSPLGVTNTADFAYWLPENLGIVGIPGTVFYQNPERGAHYIRLAFCKYEDTIQRTADKLRELPSVLANQA